MTKARFLIILLSILAIAGCGVEWFPPYERQPTTPDPFSFAAKNDVPLNSTVTSDAITVAGLTAESSPISVTGSDGSKSLYSINGGTAVATDGAVKNGDTVTVQHTSSTLVGTATTTKLRIGDVSATFTSTTVRVVLPAFEATTVAAGTVANTSGVVQALDTSSDPHEISVTDGLFSLDNDVFSTSQTTTFLSGRTIFLRTTAPAAGSTKEVVLTVDGISTTWAVSGR